MSKSWFQHSNCFLVRYTVDPTRREDFLGAIGELFTYMEDLYNEHAFFAFQGWARDPNVWVAIAAWKTEEILAEIRQLPRFQDISMRMLDCCSAPMVMEQFSGMQIDRSVFDLYPAGSSRVHTSTKALEVTFI